MRIFGSNAAAQVATTPAARRAASGSFSVSAQDAPKATAAPAALCTVGGIDALLALQGADDPLERRRRAVKRGGIALDVLDDLKLALLAGELGPSVLMRLKSAATDLAGASGDPRLDGVLAEIELRLEVEIAKMTPRTAL
jgi:hypothetical protein